MRENDFSGLPGRGNLFNRTGAMTAVMAMGTMLLRRSGALALGLGFALMGLSGCLAPEGDGDDPGEDLPGLEVYEYRYRGDDVLHPHHPYGWMLRVTNTADEERAVRAEAGDPGNMSWGPVDASGWLTDAQEEPRVLAQNESLLFLFQWDGALTNRLSYGVSLMEPGGNDSQPVVLQTLWLERGLQQPQADLPVRVNDHVTTRTVGVWVNGTSFYTNIKDLNDDPAFPAGYDRDDFGDAILHAYVYDEETDEQPPGSRDRCFVVMIAGYNALMKTQAQGSSNVRFLQPEEAYTREGAEDHFLYGDALVFLNTVVAHEGEVTPVQSLPYPPGDCHDPMHASPVPLPQLP